MTKAPPKCSRERVIPAGFAWRGGRPRWIPSPTRRKQGWRSVDLKDAWRNWLPKGAAIERAEAIAKAVAAWAAGAPVPAGYLNIAPKGAEVAGLATGAANPRAIGALLEEYYATDRFKALAAATQADYRSKHKRFLETLIGSTDAAKLAAAKALDVDVLLPPAFGEAGEAELERCYDALAASAGASMAYGVHAAVSAWLSWGVKKKRLWPTNPAGLVERTAPQGRIVVYDWPEFVALVARADARGRPSIGDAFVLGVDLSWSEQDLLAIACNQISEDFHVKHRRIKTGNAGNPPLLQLGRQRVLAIRARWLAQGVEMIGQRPLLICEMTGEAWKADTFRHEVAAIRADVAAGDKKTGRAPLPSVLAKQFRDTRDTAITYAYEAGLGIPEICSRTLHSPERAQAVISKHYGAIRQGLADAAAEKLDAHFAKMGYHLDAPVLALPAPKEG